MDQVGFPFHFISARSGVKYHYPRNLQLLQWQGSKCRVWPTMLKSVCCLSDSQYTSDLEIYCIFTHTLNMTEKYQVVEFFNAEVEISLMFPTSVKMFQEETTAESDKSIDVVTHAGN